MTHYAEASPISGACDAVYPSNSLKAACNVGTCESKFMTADLWHVLCLFRFCLFRASLLWFFSPGTPASFHIFQKQTPPGRVAQSVTCLATDACLTADPGVASSIPVRSHTFVEIDHEMISTVILLPSADSFKKGCCQLQAKVCARITG